MIFYEFKTWPGKRRVCNVNDVKLLLTNNLSQMANNCFCKCVRIKTQPTFISVTSATVYKMNIRL